MEEELLYGKLLRSLLDGELGLGELGCSGGGSGGEGK